MGKSKFDEERSKLDAQMGEILFKHGLQETMESLRRLMEREAEALKGNPYHGSKWQMATAIIVRADQALYGQHCGDVPPQHLRTR